MSTTPDSHKLMLFFGKHIIVYLILNKSKQPIFYLKNCIGKLIQQLNTLIKSKTKWVTNFIN